MVAVSLLFFFYFCFFQCHLRGNAEVALAADLTWRVAACCSMSQAVLCSPAAGLSCPGTARLAEAPHLAWHMGADSFVLTAMGDLKWGDPPAEAETLNGLLIKQNKINPAPK